MNDDEEAGEQGEGDETALHNRLVKPLKEEALQPAGEIAGRVRDQQQLYEETLVAPTKVAMKSKQLVREQIDTYCKKYEL